MTMIGFCTYGKRAEFISDSVSYNRSGSVLGRATKHMTLNHLDAAILTQGLSLFGDYAMSAFNQVGAQVATFDELVEVIAPHLMDVYDRALQEHPEGERRATVAIVGWSDWQEKFIGYVCAAEDDFTPVETRGLWVIPSPWTYRPSDLERERIVTEKADNPDTDRAIKVWANKPKSDKPATIEDWCQVANDVREQRALTTFASVYVAGDVTHTRLERGSVISQRILTFNDEGEEFRALVRGSMHPISLAEACWCESGKTYGNCHAAPCKCGSGKPTFECCLARVTV